ncbi:MAG: ATP-dependent zinc protease [Sphingomonadaceae bacterium]
MSARSRERAERPVIGWREWVLLPPFTDIPVKAKIDTGARTSAIHSFRTRRFSDRGAPHVEFVLHPLQRRRRPEIACTAPIKDERLVRSSSGVAAMRYVIETEAQLGPVRWKIELTLADRDVMGFRMLLGREALRGRFLVDPGRSYCLSGDIARERKKARSR